MSTPRSLLCAAAAFLLGSFFVASSTTSAQAKRLVRTPIWGVIVAHSEGEAQSYGKEGWEPVGIESHPPAVDPSRPFPFHGALHSEVGILMKKRL